MLVDSVLSLKVESVGVSLLKSKQHRQKNIHNKAMQIEIHLYINKYIVKNITNVQNIACQIFVCVCVRERAVII